HVLDELNYHWFEEPVHDAQTDILKRLADQLRTPILAAETTTAHEVPDYIRNGSVDIVRGDAYIKGGITGLRKALATCDLFGYDVETHPAATPQLDVANRQAARSVKNSGKDKNHHPVFRIAQKSGPPEIHHKGYQLLPAGPG